MFRHLLKTGDLTRRSERKAVLTRTLSEALRDRQVTIILHYSYHCCSNKSTNLSISQNVHLSLCLGLRSVSQKRNSQNSIKWKCPAHRAKRLLKGPRPDLNRSCSAVQAVVYVQLHIVQCLDTVKSCQADVNPSPPIDSIWAVMLVSRLRGKIIRTAPCCVVYDSCVINKYW